MICAAGGFPDAYIRVSRRMRLRRRWHVGKAVGLRSLGYVMAPWYIAQMTPIHVLLVADPAKPTEIAHRMGGLPRLTRRRIGGSCVRA
jgi:hypothetical protein